MITKNKYKNAKTNKKFKLKKFKNQKKILIKMMIQYFQMLKKMIFSYKIKILNKNSKNKQKFLKAINSKSMKITIAC